MEQIREYVAALAPSTGLALLFWLLMRAMLRADRSERAMAKQVRDQERPQKDQEQRPTL